MQRKECSCASIELAKRSLSSRMATTDKINHGLEISRGKSFGLFTRSSLIGTLMRAGFFIAAIPISASAQTREQIAATQAQIAARQAQNNADPAISQAQLDETSQRDAVQAQQDVASAADQSQPQQEYRTPATSEALPVTLPPAAVNPSPSSAETGVEMTPVQEGGTDATPDKVSEGGGEQHDEAPAVTPPALRPKARGLHGYRPRQPARPQPQPTFWQRLFGHKETKKAKPAKPQQ
jgi:hypothetical protein